VSIGMLKTVRRAIMIGGFQMPDDTFVLNTEPGRNSRLVNGFVFQIAKG